MSLDPAAFRAHLEAQLEPEEGRRRSAYRDSRGYLTIGIGHLIDERLKGEISDAVIDLIFAEDMIRVVNDLDAHVPGWRDMPGPWRIVLGDLCFNMGIHGLLGFHHMLDAMKAGDGKRAAAELGDSLWAHQVQPSRVQRLVSLLCQ